MRRSSGVAPRACVRVYARVLVPPNLYIHTYEAYAGLEAPKWARRETGGHTHQPHNKNTTRFAAALATPFGPHRHRRV